MPPHNHDCIVAATNTTTAKPTTDHCTRNPQPPSPISITLTVCDVKSNDDSGDMTGGGMSNVAIVIIDFRNLGWNLFGKGSYELEEGVAVSVMVDREEDMGFSEPLFLDLLSKWKKLVQRCSTIGLLHFFDKYKYSNLLSKYNAYLWSFYQVKVQLEQINEMKELLVKINPAIVVLDDAPSGKFGGEFVDSVEALVFGLDLPLEELKELVSSRIVGWCCFLLPVGVARPL
ncbi:hypothetical protein RJ639_003281 [Escallonia herrerae]|uniref:RPW8 domain-containing protein n=1 Tax=Escallonia herrerae TaxID=1293975 RepID=A0AA88W2Q4_9ASTE|nr:hypothetical protein RJ639_003281 [Escallonia herrerae]